MEPMKASSMFLIKMFTVFLDLETKEIILNELIQMPLKYKDLNTVGF